MKTKLIIGTVFIAGMAAAAVYRSIVKKEKIYIRGVVPLALVSLGVAILNLILNW